MDDVLSETRGPSCGFRPVSTDEATEARALVAANPGPRRWVLPCVLAAALVSLGIVGALRTHTPTGPRGPAGRNGVYAVERARARSNSDGVGSHVGGAAVSVQHQAGRSDGGGGGSGPHAKVSGGAAASRAQAAPPSQQQQQQRKKPPRAAPSKAGAGGAVPSVLSWCRHTLSRLDRESVPPYPGPSPWRYYAQWSGLDEKEPGEPQPYDSYSYGFDAGSDPYDAGYGRDGKPPPRAERPAAEVARDAREVGALLRGADPPYVINGDFSVAAALRKQARDCHLIAT